MSKKDRDYILFLEDILNAIEKIEIYTKSISFEEFSNNNMAIDAVIRNFGVIGEASKNIPKKIKEKYPDVELYWGNTAFLLTFALHNPACQFSRLSACQHLHGKNSTLSSENIYLWDNIV